MGCACSTTGHVPSPEFASGHHHTPTAAAIRQTRRGRPGISSRLWLLMVLSPLIPTLRAGDTVLPSRTSEGNVFIRNREL